MKMDAVVPAGGTVSGAFAEKIGTPHRALAPVGPNGECVLQIVVNALRKSGKVEKIIAVAAPPVAERVSGIDLWLPAGDSGPENILRGLAAARHNAPALVCTSDLPLMTPENIRQFLDARKTDADVTLGLVSAGALNERFPDAPPSTFVLLKDTGPVTIGNLFLVKPEILTRNTHVLEKTFAGRKSQMRLAALLGPRLIFQFLTRTLALSSIVARAEHLLGCGAEILHHTPPELAFDMDCTDDYSYAHAVLCRHAAAAV